MSVDSNQEWLNGEPDGVPHPNERDAPEPTPGRGTGGQVAGEEPEKTSRGAGLPPHRLPEVLADRFETLPEESRVSGEARVMVVKDRVSEEQFALKVYRADIEELDEGTVRRLLGDDPDYQVDLAHVAELLECDQVRYEETGTIHWYELLEHLPGGSLAEMLQQPTPPAVEDIFEELYRAISHFHALGLRHGDIKPQNILVRERDPLDLVLADYGSAEVVDEEYQFGVAGYTPRYAAPEVFLGMRHQASDVWSLGQILLQALSRSRPLSDVPDNAVGWFISKYPMEIPKTIDERWALLLRGLLTRDEEQRWGRDRIEAWKRGESPPEFFDADPTRPFRFAGEAYETPTSLAAALATSWGKARQAVERGHIETWVHKDLRDYELADYVRDLDESNVDLDVQVFRLIHRFNPSLQPTYRGIALTLEGLLSLADAATKDDGVQAAVTLMSLFDNRILDIVGREWDEPEAETYEQVDPRSSEEPTSRRADTTRYGHYSAWDNQWREQVTEFMTLAQDIQRSGGPSLPFGAMLTGLKSTSLSNASNWSEVADGPGKRQVALIYATLLQVVVEGRERLNILEQQLQTRIKPESNEVHWYRQLLRPDRK